MVKNWYKSSPMYIAHGTHTKFGARFYIHHYSFGNSVSENENIHVFRYYTIMRLMQTVLFAYVKLNI